MIIQLGETVIVKALAQLQQWTKDNLRPVPIAINISGKHLVSEDLVPFIKTQLDHFGIDGKFLEIEITEGVLLNDINRCIEVMTELKALNINLCIDDFGTGYSSLNYLKRLPIDILKIDQSFVRECDTETEDFEICATIINLAKNLGLTTVAEGVEKEQHWQILADLGCLIYQGYYFYEPLDHKQIEFLLADKNIRVVDRLDSVSSSMPLTAN